MKNILSILAFTCGSALATPYYQHANLTPSNIQGELFQGAMRTNAGWSDLSLLPLFYRNADSSAPWYEPSSAWVVGGAAGGGNTNAVAGFVVDGGPQVLAGIESGLGLFSAALKAGAVEFFNCASAANTCASFSSGVLANGTLEENGAIVHTLKGFGRHPFGQFLGLSVIFK